MVLLDLTFQVREALICTTEVEVVLAGGIVDLLDVVGEVLAEVDGEEMENSHRYVDNFRKTVFVESVINANTFILV